MNKDMKNLLSALKHIQAAEELLHDTGDTESEELDVAFRNLLDSRLGIKKYVKRHVE